MAGNPNSVWVDVFDFASRDVVTDEIENVTLPEFISILQEKLSAVPDIYKNKAVVALEIESDYDGPPRLIFNCGFWRTETPEEQQQRQSEEDASRRANDADNEARERAEYERLKAKFW